MKVWICVWKEGVVIISLCMCACVCDRVCYGVTVQTCPLQHKLEEV